MSPPFKCGLCSKLFSVDTAVPDGDGLICRLCNLRNTDPDWLKLQDRLFRAELYKETDGVFPDNFYIYSGFIVKPKAKQPISKPAVEVARRSIPLPEVTTSGQEE